MPSSITESNFTSGEWNIIYIQKSTNNKVTLNKQYSIKSP